MPAAPPVNLDGEVLGRAGGERVQRVGPREIRSPEHDLFLLHRYRAAEHANLRAGTRGVRCRAAQPYGHTRRSEEHTSELQSHSDLVCRLLLEKKKKTKIR